MNANLRTYFIAGLAIMVTFVFASPAQAQSNATDSTFFPMHEGNRWVYMSYSMGWQTSYFVYDLTGEVENYGDTLYVWEGAFHPIIFPPLELGFDFIEDPVTVQFDIKNNRIYGEGAHPYGKVLLADFNLGVGERWELWRFRQENALEDDVVYREILGIREITMNGSVHTVIDIEQYSNFKYDFFRKGYSFATGLGQIMYSGCIDCYVMHLHASKINGVVNGDITVSNEDDRAFTPDAFRLDTAYPNPFNPTTTLRFALVQSGEVSLAVYDVLGRQVLAQNLGALHAGEHHYTLDLSGHPSGTYLVRLQSGGQVRSTRVMLVK